MYLSAMTDLRERLKPPEEVQNDERAKRENLETLGGMLDDKEKEGVP